MNFKNIKMSGISEEEVLLRAKSFKKNFEARFGKGSMSLQDAIDYVIDAAIEHAQG